MSSLYKVVLPGAPKNNINKNNQTSKKTKIPIKIITNPGQIINKIIQEQDSPDVIL